MPNNLDTKDPAVLYHSLTVMFGELFDKVLNESVKAMRDKALTPGLILSIGVFNAHVIGMIEALQSDGMMGDSDYDLRVTVKEITELAAKRTAQHLQTLLPNAPQARRQDDDITDAEVIELTQEAINFLLNKQDSAS